MQILSALDAISPAFSRTKLILFSPFRKGRSWKLAVTAYLSVVGTMFIPYFLIGLFFIPMARDAGGSTAVAILVGVSLGATLIYLVLFYLCSRLGFAFFDIALNRGEFVAPAWRKYGSQSFKWTAFKVVLGTVTMGIIALPLAAWTRHMIMAFSALQLKPGQQPPPELIAAIFASYAAFFLIYLGFGILFLINSLLGNFIVPSLALENTTLTEAFQRLGKLIRNEPGQFTLYAVMKVVLAVTGYVAQMLVFYIVLFIVIIVFALIGLAAGSLLHVLGVSMPVLEIIGAALAVPIYIFLVFYLMFLAIGTVVTFMESYSLYFLGGRYPMLGDLLDRSTPPRPVYPYPPPPPSYYAPPVIHPPQP